MATGKIGVQSAAGKARFLMTDEVWAYFQERYKNSEARVVPGQEIASLLKEGSSKLWPRWKGVE